MENIKTTDEPVNLKKLDYDMSMAPFLGAGRIEYESSYNDIEKELSALEAEKTGWIDFFKNEKELEELLIEGSLVTIETKKYRARFSTKPGYNATKFKAEGVDYQTKFYTWGELVELLALWKKEKFNSNLIVNPETHCVNRNFRHIHAFKHKRGFILANQFDMTYPDEIMKACIILGK